MQNHCQTINKATNPATSMNGHQCPEHNLLAKQQQQHSFLSTLHTRFASCHSSANANDGEEAEFAVHCGKSEKMPGGMCGAQLAKWLDARDPLGHLREEFHVPLMETLPGVDLTLVSPQEECIYLCGNSVGLQPKCTRQFVEREMQRWAEMGVHGHFAEPEPWIHCDDRLLPDLACLVGARAVTEVGLMNSTTVNIHLLFTAFYHPTQPRNKVLLEARAFPSDHYAVEAQIRLHGFDPEEAMICMEPRPGEECLRTEDIVERLERDGHTIAIVFFSAIQYYTGQLFDIERITKCAKAKGCLAGWDLAHAIANVPLQLHDWGVPFACWCTYKYACAGPGGVGGMFIHEDLFADGTTTNAKNSLTTTNRLLGWWGHRLPTRFQMSNRMELADGVAGFRLSTPPALLMACVRASLHVLRKTTMVELRRKSLLLTGYLEFLLDTKFELSELREKQQQQKCHECNGDSTALGGDDKKMPMEMDDDDHNELHQCSTTTTKCEGRKIRCTIITPRGANERGCQLSLKFTANCRIDRLHAELGKRGVVVDKRHPDVLRVAPTHLYNTFWDVWRFVGALFEAIDLLEAEQAEEADDDEKGKEEEQNDAFKTKMILQEDRGYCQPQNGGTCPTNCVLSDKNP